MNQTAVKRQFRIGTLNSGRKRRAVITVTAQLESGRLSIQAVAKRPGASDIDQGGQMHDTLLSQDFLPGYGWTMGRVRELVRVWERWHLNDMRGGSPTQEQFLREHPVTFTFPDSHYEAASKALAAADLNPDTNGYKYGSAWLYEELPAEVVAYVEGLPNEAQS